MRSIDWCNKNFFDQNDPRHPYPAHRENRKNRAGARPRRALAPHARAPRAREKVGAPEARENFRRPPLLRAIAALAAALAAAVCASTSSNCTSTSQREAHGQVSRRSGQGEGGRPAVSGCCGARACGSIPSSMWMLTDIVSTVSGEHGQQITCCQPVVGQPLADQAVDDLRANAERRQPGMTREHAC